MNIHNRIANLISKSSFIEKWGISHDTEAMRLYELLIQVTADAQPLFEYIPRVFPEYTPHDLFKHSLNVLDAVDWIIIPTVFRKLSTHDRFFLAAGSLLHDIGMAVGAEQLENISSSSSYKQFCERLQQVSLETIPDELLIQDYLRANHHVLSGEWIRTYFERRDPGIGEVVALLAESHGRDLVSIINDPRCSTSFAFSPGCIADIPFLAIIVRLADLFDITYHRAPWQLYDFVRPSGTVSQLEWKKHLATIGIARHSTRQGVITVNAICKEPETFHNLKRFEKYVRDQIHETSAYFLTRKELPDLAIQDIEFNIDTRGFLKKKWEFSLDRGAVFNLLMGHRLYSNPMVTLRELVQNSIDAIRQKSRISPRDYTPMIKIALSRTNNNFEFTIEDNGIGMDENIVENFFLKVGKPYYGSEAYRLAYQLNERIEPLSRFGIGFISVFMIADKVTVDTLRAGSPPMRFEMTDVLNYLVVTESHRTSPGTTITLLLKPGLVVYKEPTEGDLETGECEPDMPQIGPSYRFKPYMSRMFVANDPNWSPELRNYRSTRDPYRLAYPQRNISILSLEASLEVFIGYLEFPIYYKELWNSDYRSFQRLHSNPPSNCVMFEANQARDNGIQGRVMICTPGHLPLHIRDIISQNGIRVHALEFSHPLPEWCSESYAELDLSGAAKVELLASREEVAMGSIGWLREHLEKFLRESITRYHKSTSDIKGPLLATRHIIWRLFKMQASLNFETSHRLLDALAGLLPIPTYTREDRYLSTISQVKTLGKPVRLVITKNNDFREQLNDVVQLLVWPDPTVLSVLVPTLVHKLGENFEIMDTIRNILFIRAPRPCVSSNIEWRCEEYESFNLKVNVPRLLFGHLAKPIPLVQETECLGILSYVLNGAHACLNGLESTGKQRGWISSHYDIEADYSYITMPAIVDLIRALDQLSGAAPRIVSVSELIEIINKAMETLRAGGETVSTAPNVSEQDLPSPWTRS